MAGLSRVPTNGTVYTRVANLIRADVMKSADRPLWYDVMVAFPPKDEDALRGIDHGPLVREILYPEDEIRAKFYKLYESQKALNMTRHNSVSNTPCARFIAKYRELEKNWSGTDDQLFVATGDELTKEGFHLNQRRHKRVVSQQLSPKGVVSETLASMFQKSVLHQNRDTHKTQSSTSDVTEQS